MVASIFESYGSKSITEGNGVSVSLKFDIATNSQYLVLLFDDF